MTPRVVDMRVLPVAGRDSMLLNLSGAHAPYFTRNVVKSNKAIIHELQEKSTDF